MLRQSVYSRLDGYDDTNDAERLAQDPAMRVVVGWQGSDRSAASTSEMGRFKTETYRRAQFCLLVRSGPPVLTFVKPLRAISKDS